MKISDRAIGYLSLLGLICIFASVSYGMYNAHQEVNDTALVDFDELGTLQPEDVVVVRGYRVGTIGKVTWLGDRSRVQIKFDTPVILREGTEFNNVNYALMGQRRLEIVPSKTGKILPKDYVHKGYFEPGIAEALRLMEDVNRQITYVREAVMLIVNGDSSHASAEQKYEEIVGGIEQILEDADRNISAIQPKIKSIFNEIEGASNTLIDITNRADTTIKSVAGAVDEKIASAENVITTLSEGVAKTNQVISEIESNPTLQKFTASRETIDKVNMLITKVCDLIAAIDTKDVKIYDDNGNPVKLITWKNTNLIGKTAREKAKIRAEKGESLPE
ncbi:MAG: mammalian cell entry protein [Fibrobacter sp.]|uniref:MlaD family protein n=1 Tax=Fibrobacter sp. TaxID=35828 RepID=UPI00388F8EDC|nr:mammalian cell entry protein [Fibrobacter sp.]